MAEPKSDPNKQAEVCAESFVKMARSHMWFSKDHSNRIKGCELMRDKVIHRAISQMHRESAAVLRSEAKRVRKKP